MIWEQETKCSFRCSQRSDKNLICHMWGGNISAVQVELQCECSHLVYMCFTNQTVRPDGSFSHQLPVYDSRQFCLWLICFCSPAANVVSDKAGRTIQNNNLLLHNDDQSESLRLYLYIHVKGKYWENGFFKHWLCYLTFKRYIFIFYFI